jgi:hypothetical protein
MFVTASIIFDNVFYLYRQMDKDIEERLRQKYALIDRTDPSAIQAAQQVIIEYTAYVLS